MFDDLIESCLELSAAELDEIVHEAELELRRAGAKLAAASALIEARQSYRDDGHASMRSYLKANLNCSGTEANRVRRRAALVNRHPDVGSAWLGGHIGTDQVDTLSKAHRHPRAGDRFAEFEPMLLDHAEHLEHIDFDRVVDQFITFADTDGAFDDQQFREDERTASVTITAGAVDVRATGGSALAAAEIEAVFRLACEAEFERDCAARRAEFGDDALAHPLPRTAHQRRFDALHQIFLGWATVPADGRAPTPIVNIVIDQMTAGESLTRHGLAGDVTVFGETSNTELLDRRCSTSTGVAVHPDVALRAMIQGHVRRVVVDAAGVVVDLGRSRRLFTGKAREAAQLLAVSCSHRGCDIPAEFCDVDHLDEWAADGGSTDQHNSGPLCGSHDRFKHRHRLRARRSEDGRIRLLRADGTVIKPVGERDPEWADGPDPVGDAARPRLDLLDPAHLVSWSEFVERRPRLADRADPGWEIFQFDWSELQHST